MDFGQLVIRIHGITSPNDFIVSIKEGVTPYPLDSGYVQYETTFSGGTSQIELFDASFNYDSEYWIKITDVVTNRYVIKNIKTHNSFVYNDCINPLE